MKVLLIEPISNSVSSVTFCAARLRREAVIEDVPLSAAVDRDRHSRNAILLHQRSDRLVHYACKLSFIASVGGVRTGSGSRAKQPQPLRISSRKSVS